MKKIIAIFLLIFGLNCLSYGQSNDDLNIFGFFQSSFKQSLESTWKMQFGPQTFEFVIPGYNTFKNNQLNLFLQKDFKISNLSLTSFVNFEAVGSFSTYRNWGSFSIEEAWVKANFSDALNIKVGQLIPEFNLLNTTKNRTPSQPFIERPLAYETNERSTSNMSPYIPEYAFMQVYGKLPLTEMLKFDYAVYGGNLAPPDLTTTGMGGEDNTSFKMIGSRIGFTYDNIKAGISSTWDREKYQKIFDPAGLNGNIPRIRFGADISLHYFGFTLEAEYMSVNYTLSDAHTNWLKTNGYLNYLYNTTVLPKQQKIAQLSQAITNETNPNVKSLLTESLDNAQADFATSMTDYNNASSMNGISDLNKIYYYITLGYNITDELYVYGFYNKIIDHANTFNTNEAYYAGASYRASDNLVLKAQYVHVNLLSMMDATVKFYTVGFSLMF